jgi:nucleoside 2-deoxyribosyltransferase
MKIFLAGKIKRVCWRHQLVRGLDSILEQASFDDGWPVMEKAIFGRYDFVGPYFRPIQKMLPTQKIHRLCMEAIETSDLVFSWFDDPEAYATMFEFGYAKAKGVPVIIAYPDGVNIHEFWFQCCSSDHYFHAPGPVTAFKTAMMKYHAMHDVSATRRLSSAHPNEVARPSEDPAGESPQQSQGGDAGGPEAGERTPGGGDSAPEAEVRGFG